MLKNWGKFSLFISYIELKRCVSISNSLYLQPVTHNVWPNKLIKIGSKDDPVLLV